MDDNGYNESLFDTTEGVCYLCKERKETVRHEVYEGNGRRALSKRYGLWVNICPGCHSEVHLEPECEKAIRLKQEAKDLFIQEHSPGDFIRIFEIGNVKWWEL